MRFRPNDLTGITTNYNNFIANLYFSLLGVGFKSLKNHRNPRCVVGSVVKSCRWYVVCNLLDTIYFVGLHFPFNLLIPQLIIRRAFILLVDTT